MSDPKCDWCGAPLPLSTDSMIFDNGRVCIGPCGPKAKLTWIARPVEGGQWLYLDDLNVLADMVDEESRLELKRVSVEREKWLNVGEFNGW